MSRSYDIFLSHSGAQKDFVEHLNAELVRVCGHYSVFFDRDAIEHGEQISTAILEYARTCKLAVAVVSDEYFTRSRPPMMELAASYTAAKVGNGIPSLPCLLPVFLALRPEDAKDSSTQSRWRKMWQKWEVNEKMSERRKSRPSRVQPTVWKEAVDRLLDTRGPIYIPQENGYDPEVFMKKVAQVIARKLDVLNGGVGPSKVGDQLMPPSKEVGPSRDTSVEENSSENSNMDSGLVFNHLLGSGSSRVAGKVTDGKEALPEPCKVEVGPSGDTSVEEDSSENSSMDSGPIFNLFLGSGSSQVAGKVTDGKDSLPEACKVVVCLEFGSTSSSFSFSRISSSENIKAFNDYPRSRMRKPNCKIATGIYYSSRDGGQSYQVESWGNLARSSYERDEREAGRSSENFLGIYVTRFNPHLKVRDMQISTTKKLKLPYSLPVDRPITDYLHEFGTFILSRLQERLSPNLTMKMIQWCVPVPSSWDNAAQEKMKTCMESAGLINGTDGSLSPVKMVGELEAASLCSLRYCDFQLGDKLLVVGIGESFFEVVVQEIVSVCKHIHRVKEVSSRLFTRHSSPDSKFRTLLQCKIGPYLQELLTEHPTEYEHLIDQWDSFKDTFGDAMGLRVPTEMQGWRRKGIKLQKKRRNYRVPGIEWDTDDDGVIEISYDECQSVFVPVVEELLSCISKTFTEVGGGVKFLVLVGDWLAGSPYVMVNIKRRFSSQVTKITCPTNLNAATCLGGVALARDLCNATSSTS